MQISASWRSRTRKKPAWVGRFGLGSDRVDSLRGEDPSVAEDILRSTTSVLASLKRVVEMGIRRDWPGKIETMDD